LRQLGVDIRCEGPGDFPPVTVQAKGLKGGRVSIKGDTSSQFLSGLLMAAPFAQEEVLIEVVGPLVSQPYVAMTIEMMRQFGEPVQTSGLEVFRVPRAPCYRAVAYDVEPDASAASYFLGAAAITGGEVTIAGLGKDSLQGDAHFSQVLEQMGCGIARAER